MYLPFFFFLSISLAIYLFWFLTLAEKQWRSSSKGKLKLPPGPIPFPIVGSLLELGNQPHRSLARLAKTHGPLMALKLGSITTVIASSPTTAKEVLQKHDHKLSGRTVPDVVRSLRYHEVSLAWSPPNQNWRNLRKYISIHLVSPKSLNTNRPLRCKTAQKLVEFIRHNGNMRRTVDIGQAAYVTNINLISNTVFSKDAAGFNSESALGFIDIMRGYMEAGKPNIADYFPWLRFMDPQGRRRLFAGHMKKLYEFFDEMIIPRQLLMQSRGTTEEPQDLLDVLLQDFHIGRIDLQTIRSLLAEIFVAGTDSSAAFVEWAMAELMRNPSVMAKAQQELTEAINSVEDVDELLDISQLPYMQAVVKETFRLHPPGPLFIPHRAEDDVDLCNYLVPKHAQVIVNAWAIGRDAEFWRESEAFIPERFLGVDTDFKGQDFQLIPFGSGRRMCPGLPLANRMVHLMLASFLRWFDWELPDGMRPSDMDMREKFGLSLRMVAPLQAMPTAR